MPNSAKKCAGCSARSWQAKPASSTPKPNAWKYLMRDMAAAGRDATRSLHERESEQERLSARNLRTRSRAAPSQQYARPGRPRTRPCRKSHRLPARANAQIEIPLPAQLSFETESASIEIANSTPASSAIANRSPRCASKPPRSKPLCAKAPNRRSRRRRQQSLDAHIDRPPPHRLRLGEESVRSHAES